MLRLVTLLATITLAACASPPWQQEGAPAAEPTPAGLEVYMETLDALVRASPDERSKIYESVASQYRRTPTTTNRLRFALVLSTPGHPAADPGEAARILSDILADPVGLLPMEMSLARVQLQHAEALARLEAQNRQLAATMEELRRRGTQEASRALQAAMQENAALRARLAEAEAKLEAISTIERAVLERDESLSEPP